MKLEHAVLSVAEHAQADAAAGSLGVSMETLMEAAGAAVAQAVQARPGWDQAPFGPCLVLCGPGDNGGDGWVVARLLRAAGCVVRVMAFGEPRSAAAKAARAAWAAPVEPLRPLVAADAGIVVDALFGAGLDRALPPEVCDVIESLARRRSQSKVVAVDLPSGIRGDDGRAFGPAFNADLTVSFLALKPAHVLEPSRSACGVLILADIGHPEGSAPQARAWENAPALWRDRFVWPERLGHKHDRGRLFVLAGPAHRTGAARLAARAGLRAGAGLATIVCAPDALGIVAASSLAVMTAPADGARDIADACAKASAIVAGPALGLGEATRDIVSALSKAGGGAALVLDADALSSFAGQSEALFARLGASDVITPHDGEFRRLFPDLDAADLGRLAAARAAAARCGCVVLLKGPDTVVAAPDGRASVNTRSSPFLATAGSGDVLAGIVGGLIAQGMASFEAASAAVWLHGDAGARLGPGLIADDLPEALPVGLKALYDGR